MSTFTQGMVSYMRERGAWLLGLLEEFGAFARFTAEILHNIVTLRFDIREWVLHLAILIYRCVIPVCATVAPVSLVLALQGSTVFELFGAERLLSFMLGQAVFRDISPVLSSTLLAAQGGAAFTAELGSMRVQEQIDATEVMGVDPMRFHVAPRVLAMVAAAPMLSLMGSVAGMIAGYLAAVVIYGQDPAAFLYTLYTSLTMTDIFAGLMKVSIFGIAMGLIACYLGFNAKGGALGVGKAVNATVVRAVVTMLVMNYFLSSALMGVLN